MDNIPPFIDLFKMSYFENRIKMWKIKKDIQKFNHREVGKRILTQNIKVVPVVVFRLFIDVLLMLVLLFLVQIPCGDTFCFGHDTQF